MAPLFHQPPFESDYSNDLLLLTVSLKYTPLPKQFSKCTVFTQWIRIWLLYLTIIRLIFLSLENMIISSVDGSLLNMWTITMSKWINSCCPYKYKKMEIYSFWEMWILLQIPLTYLENSIFIAWNRDLFFIQPDYAIFLIFYILRSH